MKFISLLACVALSVPTVNSSDVDPKQINQTTETQEIPSIAPESKVTEPDATLALLELVSDTAIVFPAIGSTYVRGVLQKNKSILILYNSLRMGYVKCRYINICWKYDGIGQKRRCSHEIRREAAIMFEFNLARAGSITFDFVAHDNGKVCASEENLKFKIPRKWFQ